MTAEIQALFLELSVRVLTFNAPFGFSILRAECEQRGFCFELPGIMIDPFVIDKQVDRHRSGKRQLANVTQPRFEYPYWRFVAL